MEVLRAIALAVSMFVIMMGLGLSPYNLDFNKTEEKAVTIFVWCVGIFLVSYMVLELYWVYTNPNWYDMRTFNK